MSRTLIISIVFLFSQTSIALGAGAPTASTQSSEILKSLRPYVKRSISVTKKGPKFRVEMWGEPYSGDEDPEKFFPQALVIRDSTGKISQIVPTKELESPYQGATYLIVDDFNFDGNKEFAILGFWGATGLECYEVILWIPETARFEQRNSLRQLCNFSVDNKSKTISETWKGGTAGSEHGTQTFTVLNNERVLIRKISVLELANECAEVTIEKFHHGKTVGRKKHLEQYGEATDSCTP